MRIGCYLRSVEADGAQSGVVEDVALEVGERSAHTQSQAGLDLQQIGLLPAQRMLAGHRH